MRQPLGRWRMELAATTGKAGTAAKPRGLATLLSLGLITRAVMFHRIRAGSTGFNDLAYVFYCIALGDQDRDLEQSD